MFFSWAPCAEMKVGVLVLRKWRQVVGQPAVSPVVLLSQAGTALVSGWARKGRWAEASPVPHTGSWRPSCASLRPSAR